MHILRKVGRVVCTTVFGILLFSIVLVFAVNNLISSPKTVERALDKSGIYDKFFDIAFNKSDSNDKSSDTGFSLSDPKVQQIAGRALPPAKLKQIVETALDGGYAYVKSGAQSSVVIDLRSSKVVFAAGMSNYAVQRLAKLPVCSQAQLLAQGSDVDPFSAKCKPGNINIVAQKKKVSKDIITSKDLPDTIKLDFAHAKSVDKGRNKVIGLDLAKTKQAGILYDAVNIGPWVLMGLAIVFAGSALWLAEDKKRSLKSLSILLLVNGSILLLISLLLLAGATKSIHSTSDSAALQAVLVAGVQSLVKTFAGVLVCASGIYLISGGALLTIYNHLLSTPGSSAKR